MTQTRRNSALLLNNKLNFNSDSWIVDFIEASHDSCYIKDTHKYLLVNTGLAKWCGIEQIDMFIGTSPDEFWIEDVCHRRNKLRLNSAVIQCEKYETKMAEVLEDKVRSNKRPAAVNHVVLDFSGFICYANTTKIPILDCHRKKVIAFITLCRYLTSQCDLSKLFQRYLKYYPHQTAIELLLKYLKIDSYFYRPPTFREMQVLLSLHQQPNRKKAAPLLDISCNTLAAHIQHIKERKLIKPDLNEVLMQLRQAPMDKNSNFNQNVCQ